MFIDPSARRNNWLKIQRVVYTYFNDRLDEDLRHEATHALLNVVMGDLPLWADEGLAEYFEGPSGGDGLNRTHLARLPDDRKSGWQPDLARPEAISAVRRMTRDYRESWAWSPTYLLNGPLRGAGATVELSVFARVRPNRIMTRLAATERNASGLMLAHLEQLKAPPVVEACGPGKISPVSQNTAIESPKRAGLIDRLLAALGLR